MRIKELHLINWRVIRDAQFESLSDFVVIAGPNGVGKSHVKAAIVHIFQNNGNPPAQSKVILQATNEQERAAWQADEISLPKPTIWNFFATQTKRLKTKSRIIQIDSDRIVENIQFQQLTFDSVGDPENENVAHNYGFNNVKSRFNDICLTLYRLKSRQVTSVYTEYVENIDKNENDVLIKKLIDPTQKIY